ncbi:putative WAT1-related protein [Tanacetum coccineum]
MEIPSEVLEVLPSDPFEQLDLARKITSVALFTRISALESESSVLRDQLADRDDLWAQVESLNVALSEAVEKLSRADQQALESFRKTLMMSLQDEDGSSAKDPPKSFK